MQRIEGLLAPVVGSDRVRATVSAELDFTVNEQTRESFDPDGTMVRSEQTSEDSQAGGGVQGVPGALSNQPPQVAATTTGTTGEQTDSPRSTARTQVRNFELDKTVSHTRQAVGAIKRLSIGVLVDNKPPANGRGESQPLPEAELASLTELVKQAVGFDETRGDSISVLNSAFQAPAKVQAPQAPSFWDRPQVWSIGRQALGAVLVLALAFFVLKPMMQVLTRPQPALPMPPGGPDYGGNMFPAPASGARSMGLPVSYDDRMAAARSVAGQDPRQVAQVVRNWVGEDDG